MSIADSASDAEGEPEVRAVDYCFEEYTVDPMFESARRQSWSQLIVEALESGEMYQDGTEVVDGRELIRVRETSTDYGRWLIDPDTYRPVRLVGEVGDGNEMAYVTTFDCGSRRTRPGRPAGRAGRHPSHLRRQNRRGPIVMSAATSRLLDRRP